MSVQKGPTQSSKHRKHREPGSAHQLEIRHVSPHSLKPYPGNARVHSKRQIRSLAASIQRFGYTQPALVSEKGEIIAGHGRVEAAKHVGLATIPVIRIDHLSDVDRRAYILADNQLALKAGWDKEMLAIELQHLVEVGFDLEIAGFEPTEVDLLLEISNETQRDPDADDIAPARSLDRPSITKPGDVWLLGSKDRQHKLLCADARDSAALMSLMGRDRAAMLLSDPPYNVRVSATGRHRNNVELGKNGRNRTNVWEYAGVNTFRADRGSELAMHPTVKPVAMIADAVRDITKQGDIVLDPFSGSGTTIIAAEKTGRLARAVEIDPRYCDVAIRRWEAFTGKTASLAETRETFETTAERRHQAIKGKVQA